MQDHILDGLGNPTFWHFDTLTFPNVSKSHVVQTNNDTFIMG